MKKAARKGGRNGEKPSGKCQRSYKVRLAGSISDGYVFLLSVYVPKSGHHLSYHCNKKEREEAKHMAENSGRHPCPVCGRTMFEEYDSYDICMVCGWEDDAMQEEFPVEGGGPNDPPNE